MQVATISHYHIEAQRKWPTLSRQHFEIHFVEWKLFCFERNFNKICSLRSHYQVNNETFEIPEISWLLFTRGQFWPSGIVVACVCVCVCLSVNHQLVRAITDQPFKLESPNLDQRCKRPWLRSLLFFGTIDLELQGQIELKSQNLPHFELVRAKSHHQLKSVFPNLGQKCILALLRSLLILGWIDLDVLFHF